MFFLGGGVRAKEAILIAQHLDKNAASRCVQTNFAGRSVDSGLGRRMGVVRSYLLEIFKKGGKEFGRVGDVAK